MYLNLSSRSPYCKLSRQLPLLGCFLILEQGRKKNPILSPFWQIKQNSLHSLSQALGQIWWLLFQLNEECKCKFTLDQIRQNTFLLQLTWFYCLLKLCTNFWESLKASTDFHGTIFKTLKTFSFTQELPQAQVSTKTQDGLNSWTSKPPASEFQQVLRAKQRKERIHDKNIPCEKSANE